MAVLSFGLWVWLRQRNSIANILVALLAGIFAFWVSAPWIADLGIRWRPFSWVWFVIYSASLAYGPALCLHAAILIGRRFSMKRVYTYYTIASVLACLMIFGTFLQKFGWHNVLGTWVLLVAVGGGLVTYTTVLLSEVWDNYPMALGGKTMPSETFYGLILFTLFLACGLLQLAFGPVVVQPLVALGSCLFFVVGILACMRASFLGVHLLPLEGFFLVLIWASAILLFHAKDTTEFWLSLAAVLLIGIFGRYALSSVARERARSEQMALLNEQLRQIDEARNDFTAMVAHQLRSPIGGIRAAASMLADGSYGELPPKGKEAAGLIKNAAERLLGLAETYLQGVRMHQGIFATKPTETDVAEQMKTIVKELMPLAELKGIRIAIEAGPLPWRLSLDREVFSNAVFNLVDNAIKYTDKGKVSIRLGWKPKILTVEVEDTGIGMSEGEIAAIFDKFTRGSSFKARQRTGSGLGLYIVKRLLQAAGGTIQVASHGLGKGTIFTLKMPASQVDELSLAQ
jgi:signal transduction histidine kinase